MNKYGFKGNAPDSIQVIQLITFLYVGVAKLNDGRLSNNELHKIVQKHENYGVKNKDSTKFIDEAVSWWNDSLKRDVHLDDLFHCAKLLKHQEGWNDKLKDTLHMDLTVISTADGLLNLKNDKFVGERQLKIVDRIIEIFKD